MDYNIVQRVIDTTRAFEKKYFSPKEEPKTPSNLTTQQQAVVDVMLKEDFGCNQGKVRRLMAAVTGIDEKFLKGASKSSTTIPLERWLAVVDEDDRICVIIQPKDRDGDYEFNGWCRDYLDTPAWRVATNEEIEDWFAKFMR